MLKTPRKFVLLVLLLVMPLQGIAASLTDALCSSAPAPAQLSDAHGHDGPAGAPHEHDGGTGDSHAAQLCCHHFFTAVVAVTSDLGGTEPSTFDSTLPHPLRLFFPEQPLRVPVA